MQHIPEELIDRFAAAVASLERHFASAPDRLDDANVEAELRGWLDGDDKPLPWAGSGVTTDEWFFVTTLYGQRTRPVQRALIRRYLPRFVDEAGRDMRNLTPELTRDWVLDHDWMKPRLFRMAAILQDRRTTMEVYVDHLRELERRAMADDPTPALDAIVKDHRATGWKTLSVFVRDCVGGNCFPIDSRVERELCTHGLPIDESQLVSLSLSVGRNPRRVARMFYEAGGEGGNFTTATSHSSEPACSQMNHDISLTEPSESARSLDAFQEPGVSPSRRSSMVRELTTLKGEASGYILNLYGGPTGKIGNVVHPHDCPHLRMMKIPPRKMWGVSVNELEEWVRAQGGELDPKTPTCGNV
jgi:hypothetical protein